MKIFSTKVHGFLDYLVGIVLLAMPAVLKLDYANTESQVFFILGGALLFYSLLTNYELGLIRVLPMRLHLALDVLSGLLLAASPWILGFGDRIFIPYLILGVAEMIAGLTTTSKKGVPEVQEIVVNEFIQHEEMVKESSMNAQRKATAKNEKKVTKPVQKHSISETKKAAEPKKSAIPGPKKPKVAEKKTTGPDKKTGSNAVKKTAAKK